MFETQEFVLTGTAPLLMHNVRLANPLDDTVKAIKKLTSLSPKRKTEDTHAEISRLEWYGGLYVMESGKPGVQVPCIPGENIERMLLDAARQSRRGKDAESSLYSRENWPLAHDGPNDVEKLWQLKQFRDIRAVGNKGNKVMRTRPIFHNWAVRVVVHFLPEKVDRDELIHWMEVSGQFIGLMDYRPRYGRFTVEVK